jgi:hypothetical protein
MSDPTFRYRGFYVTPRQVSALIDDLLRVFTPAAVQDILNGDDLLSEHIQIMRGMAIAANPDAFPGAVEEIVDGIEMTIERMKS